MPHTLISLFFISLDYVPYRKPFYTRYYFSDSINNEIVLLVLVLRHRLYILKLTTSVGSHSTWADKVHIGPHHCLRIIDTFITNRVLVCTCPKHSTGNLILDSI